VGTSSLFSFPEQGHHGSPARMCTFHHSLVLTEEAPTLAGLRLRIQEMSVDGMIKRTPMFEEALFVMKSCRNPHQYPDEERCEYRLGFVEADEASDLLPESGHEAMRSTPRHKSLGGELETACMRQSRHQEPLQTSYIYRRTPR
jgi:hypothetical protein